MSTRANGAAVDPDWFWRDRQTRWLTHEQAVRRVRSDYLELPGLKLTLAQASRLWSLSSDLATGVLDELSASGFLVCSEGLYVRR